MAEFTAEDFATALKLISEDLSLGEGGRATLRPNTNRSHIVLAALSLAAKASAEPQPVAWRYRHRELADKWSLCSVEMAPKNPGNEFYTWEPLYASPPTFAKEEREHRPAQCPTCLAPVKDGLYHNDALFRETMRSMRVAAEEREAIVKWLRHNNYKGAPDAIERGDHHKERT